MTGDDIRFVTPPRHRRGAPAPALPLLRHETSLAPAMWLQESLTTFAVSVASFLPGHFPAYARLYHPFQSGELSPSTGETSQKLAARHGHELRDPAAAEALAYHGVPAGQDRVGSLPPAVCKALIEHLRPATTTPERCYYAIWTGFGASAVPPDLEPRLALPNREYHLFSGPLAAARISYASTPLIHQSANLWWPDDHAWCIATEVDLAWTYVGGPESCIAGILGDARLDAVATAATERW